MFYINNILFDSVEQFISEEKQRVQLSHRSAQLLELLANNANDTLSRDMIISTIWAREYVSDHSLTQAISDLRRSLAEINPEYKGLVKTRPKSGYSLCANVKFERGPEHNRAQVEAMLFSADYTRQILKKWSKYLPVFLMVLVVSLLINNSVNNAAKQTPTFNPYKVAFVIFDSPKQYIHIAYGLSDLLAYRINQQGYYHASLIYSENNDYALNAAIVISGEVIEKEKGPELHFIVTDNINKQQVVNKTYSLSKEAFVSTPKQVLLDVSPYMAEPFSVELIAKLNDNYPLKADPLNLMYQAHYASNIITSRSLHSAIRLYDEVLTHNAGLKIAAAERFISARILMDIMPESISEDEYQAMYDSLLAVKSDVYPPIYYEALSIYQFDLGNITSAKSFLQQATKVRESWLNYILLGKYAEYEKNRFRANIAYKRAYQMKPNDSTELAIRTLLFSSDFER